jgi:hypothetical protein
MAAGPKLFQCILLRVMPDFTAIFFRPAAVCPALAIAAATRFDLPSRINAR